LFKKKKFSNKVKYLPHTKTSFSLEAPGSSPPPLAISINYLHILKAVIAAFCFANTFFAVSLLGTTKQFLEGQKSQTLGLK
jgi:hypothetical protein